MSSKGLTTAIIKNVFTEEITRHSGHVSEIFDDGTRLFARSVLPHVEQVRPRDRLRGGVALRATSQEIYIRPYLFREVCRNGAIIAHSLRSRRLIHTEENREETIAAICETIAACCRKDEFETSVDEIRYSLNDDIDVALMMSPLLSRLRSSFPTDIASLIADRFQGDGDTSRFGLMNAVTSVARDTSDPDRRWCLEELGGGVPASTGPLLPRDATGARADYRVEIFRQAIEERIAASSWPEDVSNEGRLTLFGDSSQLRCV